MVTTIDSADYDAGTNNSTGNDRVSGAEQRADVKLDAPRKLPPLVMLRSYDWMDHHSYDWMDHHTLLSEMDC
ncbi:MAG TPA: hypothetical protein VJU59_23365 [Paraburkholderia sp.]|uniref:hypothetical protein n=1 Tax=Paraburkholderia sp. TaxID=1926495 RepID=UPI002B49AC56|nr:hypothetical protein [Paraburkholderia sp.]HKR42574.1 hypothetical protein [Paraburkholderia sp.]